jgi:formate C-acetyltransferase
MSEFIERKLIIASREVALRRQRPSAVLTFGDCFYTDSIKSGECFSASAKYHFEIQAFQMLGTVADCFIAFDQLVVRERKMTLGELISAVDANFEGYERILALCRKADKYGIDTELSNAHVKRITDRVSRLVIEKSRPYFERERLFLMPSIQSDTWHLKYGEQYGATVNGRLAHTAFSQNTNPTNGAAREGVTAMLNSMLNITQGGFVSGALNLDIDLKDFEGESGHARFAALLATYFNRGGLHAQVSATDAERLKEAQLDPQSHRDIRVRVTGYSGIFVDICKRLQDDIIDRFEK